MARVAMSPVCYPLQGTGVITSLGLKHGRKPVDNHLSQGAYQHQGYHSQNRLIVDSSIQDRLDSKIGSRNLHCREYCLNHTQCCGFIELVPVLPAAEIKELLHHLKHLQPPLKRMPAHPHPHLWPCCGLPTFFCRARISQAVPHGCRCLPHFHL